jgi:RNA polymerase sigma-70 factor (ECF subfamily)
MSNPGEMVSAVAVRAETATDLGHRYVACKPVIRRYLASRMRQGTTVEDMTQEVFARALRSRLRCGSQAESPQYLMGIAKNVLREYLRRQGVERKAMAGLTLVPVREASGPDVRLDRQELGIVLEAAQQGLTRLQREAVRLVWREGSSPATVAGQLGCTCKAVCRRLEAARGRLREALSSRLELLDIPGHRRPADQAPANEARLAMQSG